MKTEKLRIHHPNGIEHIVLVAFATVEGTALLRAYYLDGCTDIEKEAEIVDWCATYETPNRFGPGQAMLGDGRIDLKIHALRGIGLGSLLIRPLVSWIKSHEKAVPIVPIDLSADDAETDDKRDMRNRFYEKMGFSFDYKDGKKWGESLPMVSTDLITPKFCLSRGWIVESIEGTGEIF
jgi:GNAT superfamily N-acetyltransferase